MTEADRLIGPGHWWAGDTPGGKIECPECDASGARYSCKRHECPWRPEGVRGIRRRVCTGCGHEILRGQGSTSYPGATWHNDCLDIRLRQEDEEVHRG